MLKQTLEIKNGKAKALHGVLTFDVFANNNNNRN